MCSATAAAAPFGGKTGATKAKAELETALSKWSWCVVRVLSCDVYLVFVLCCATKAKAELETALSKWSW
jgi:hypothetical protein